MTEKNKSIRNFPNLRFPGFEQEWEVNKLGEIATISSGGTPNRANSMFWNGKIPWISTSLIDFNIIEKSEEYITEEGLKNSSAKLFPIGTLLMAMYGQGKTRGKIAMLNIEATTNQACGAITTNENILNSLFAFQNLSKRYDEIRDLSNQGGQENLSGGIIKGIEIKFPKLEEQDKITSFLSLIDKRIVSQKKIIDNLMYLMLGFREKIFSNKIRFKDEDGNDFPDWEKLKLGAIGNFQTSSIDKLSRENENEVYLVNYMNVYRHEDINSYTIKSFQKVTAKEQQIISCNLRKGDILFTPSSETPADIGHSVVISENLENAVFSYHLMRFRPKIEINTLYSHYFCNVPIVLSQLSKFATGSTRFTISVKSFSNVEIGLPKLSEQKIIGNFLSLMEKKIETERKILAQYETQKRYLLANLFI